MSSFYEDTVLNFDLDFLHQTTNSTVQNKIDKQRRAILITKQKTIAIDSLIRKYCHTKEILEQTEKTLFASKEECKQVCIDYKNALERCANIENDIHSIQSRNQELEEKCINLENQCGGLQSHTKQLEVLVKENETRIEALKIENQLEKSNNKKLIETKESLQKQNDMLIQDLSVLGKVLLGKKKLTSEQTTLLHKYQKYFKNEDNSCDDSGGANSDIEADIFEDNLMSPCTPEDASTGNNVKNQQCSTDIEETIIVNLGITKQNCALVDGQEEIDRYSDCSNEIASADTGRGSSLAFSDSEKCFYSPEYHTNENQSNLDIKTKTLKPFADVDTSPHMKDKTRHIATSPIEFEDCNIPVLTINKSLSLNKDLTSVSSYSVKNVNQIATSPINTKLCGRALDSRILQEKKCLQINSSQQFDEDNNIDGEIEMILNAMQFNNELITPIPKTPSVSRNTDTSLDSDRSQNDDNRKFLCEDAAKLREENKILHTNIADLANEILNIKKILNLQEPQPSKVINDIVNPVSDSKNQRNESLNSRNTLQGLEEEPDLPANNILQNLAEGPHLPSNNDSEDDTYLVTLEDPEINIFQRLVVGESPSSSHNHLEKQESFPVIMENSEVNSDLKYVGNKLNVTSFESQNKYKSNNAEDLELGVNEGSSNTDNIRAPSLIDEYPITSETQLVYCNKAKGVRTQKLNRLEKLRRNMIPRCNIRREIKPIGKSRVIIKKTSRNPKQLYNTNITADSSSALLNNKAAYEKAVKIMSELKSKQPDKTHNSHVKIIKSVECTLSSVSLNKQITTDKLEIVNNTKFADTSSTVNNEVAQKNANSDGTERAESNANDDKQITSHQLRADNNTILNTDCSSKSVHSKIAQDETTNRITDLKSKQVEKPLNNSGTICRNAESSTTSSDLAKQVTTKKLEVVINKDAYIEQAVRSVPGLKLKQHERNNNLNVENMKLGRSVNQLEERNAKHKRRQSNESEMLQLSPSVTTRSRRKCVEQIKIIESDLLNEIESSQINTKCITSPRERKKRLKRVADPDDKQEIECKRILRSSVRQSTNDDTTTAVPSEQSVECVIKLELENETQKQTTTSIIEDIEPEHSTCISYDDLELFTEETPAKQKSEVSEKDNESHPKHSILCAMLEKYSVPRIKYSPKKVSDTVINTISKIIDDNIKEIKELPPNDVNKAMNNLVEKLRSLDARQFIAGFMKYMQDPQRKVESYSKVHSPPAPPMTKSEQILLYIVIQLKTFWASVDIVNYILSNIEYTLFRINRTPEFDTIETLSHFYAIVCRYFKMKTRLRLFVLDAMYCMQYKAVALIRQCLDVWMHILPLAHMGIAKSPLVTCIVYLLHFYKCEDKLNRVQDIRNILNRKYSYQMTEWNEKRILEMFKNAVREMKDIPAERKMLRISLILLAKRHGPQWCQKNIITNMLQPMIEKEDFPARIKYFCVSMIGPLMKPYPVDMKVHCEIAINQLIDILDHSPSHQMQEAVFTSLIYISKHNQNRVIRALLNWCPKKVSPDCEEMLRDFVREKPAGVWRTVLSKISLSSDGQNRSLEN